MRRSAAMAQTERTKGSEVQMTTEPADRVWDAVPDSRSPRSARWSPSAAASGWSARWSRPPAARADAAERRGRRYGETLDVIWEVEPGRRVLPSGSLPEVAERGFDPPERLAAFLDAVRWGAVTTADVKTLQAPFRSGIAIEDYQLEPVVRALRRAARQPADRRRRRPRQDDRGRPGRPGAAAAPPRAPVMVVCPAGLSLKWQRRDGARSSGSSSRSSTPSGARSSAATHGVAREPVHASSR